MAAVLDTTASAVFVNAPPSVSVTIGSGSGNSRMLVCYIGAEGNVARPAFATPTFNGVNAAVLDTAFNGTLRGGVAYWRDADLPATAGTYTLTLSITNETAFDGSIHIVSVTGLAQSYLPVITETNIGSSSIDPTCTTANANSMVFCGFAGVNGDSGTPRTGAVHNGIGNLASALYDGNAGYALDTGAAGAKTVGWEITGADSWNRAVSSAIEFEPAAGGDAVVPTCTIDTVHGTGEYDSIFEAGGYDSGTDTLDVTGTAADNVAVSTVETRVNGGGWFTATDTSAGGDWSTWLQSMNATNVFSVGENTIEARATDTSANVSTLASETVWYSPDGTWVFSGVGVHAGASETEVA